MNDEQRATVQRLARLASSASDRTVASDPGVSSVFSTVSWVCVELLALDKVSRALPCEIADWLTRTLPDDDEIDEAGPTAFFSTAVVETLVASADDIARIDWFTESMKTARAAACSAGLSTADKTGEKQS